MKITLTGSAILGVALSYSEFCGGRLALDDDAANCFFVLPLVYADALPNHRKPTLRVRSSERRQHGSRLAVFHLFLRQA